MVAVVALRGTARGFEIDIAADAPLPAVIADLEARFEKAPEFFQGNDVWLHLGPRPMPPGALAQLKAITEGAGLRIVRLEAERPEVVQAAANLQIPVAAAPPAPGATASATAAPAPAESGRVVAGPIRSGAVVSTHAHLVVVGDVNAGAELRAGGDIIVLGTLRGLAHAGCLAEGSGAIIALRLEAAQLRIGAHIARGGPPAAAREPEIAYLSEGRIVVEPYRGKLPGGTPGSRR